MQPLPFFSVTVHGLLSVFLCGGVVSAAQGNPPSNASNANTLVYVGTNTGAKSKGIHFYRLQTSNLEVSQNITLVPLGLAVETPNPTFLEIDIKRRLLFTVNETEEFEGKPGGAVSVFSIDPAGKLTLLNQRSSKGPKPCYLVLDKEGRTLLVANCGSGSIAVLPVAADGKLGEAADVVPSTGSGAKPRGVTFDPASRFAFICDAGLNKVTAYRFDAQQGKLTLNEAGSVTLKAGAGPRRLVFRPDGRFAYVLNEQNSTISAFAYDADTGALSERQSLSTLPGYFDGANTTAELGMHPSGKWIYASNTGHNSVVLFDIDPSKGTLNYVEEQGTGGSNPVSFGIQPSAQHLAIANHDTDQVLASRIDAGNGRLKPSGVFAAAPSPTCVRFLPPPPAAK